MFLSVVTSARSCPKFNSTCRIILRDTIEVETIFIFQLYPIYKIYKWDNHPYYHIYSYLTIISNMIQAFYHLGTDQPLSNHCPFVIQPRSQAFAVATLDLVRHENFKLPNCSDSADFRKFSENSGKISENI